MSVDFLAGSFDSVEPALRATFDREPPPFSPAGGLPIAGPASKPNIALPELKHCSEANISMGHISPIKVLYNQNQVDQNAKTYDDVNWPCDSNGNVHSPVSNPFYVIRFASASFSNLKYKLPCLQREIDPHPVVNLNSHGHIRQYRPPPRQNGPLLVTKVATRRVEAAICAFGGTITTSRNGPTDSIFRFKSSTKLNNRRFYNNTLPQRYCLSGSRISWDFEESPPVVIPLDESDNSTVSSSREKTRKDSVGQSGSGASRASPIHIDANTTKLKYRCKQCGQLKNNHVCPYRQPLQRSIGIMVYPAVNSFTAFEPGTVAPPLNLMNNFVSYSESDGNSFNRAAITSAHSNNITPDVASGVNVGYYYHEHSPESSLSNHSTEFTRPAKVSRKCVLERKEEKDGDIPAKRNLFVTSVSLRPEHYRSVTQSSAEDSPGSYKYPAIPLPFGERRRLSDTLFFLSKEVPSLTQDCALILRQARENNEWDLAVAELLTQVAVGLFCTEVDVELEGLKRYLLAVGVSC